MIKVYKNVNEFYDNGFAVFRADTKFVIYRFSSMDLTHQQLYITYETSAGQKSNTYTK